jgi:hypothetical protein
MNNNESISCLSFNLKNSMYNSFLMNFIILVMINQTCIWGIFWNPLYGHPWTIPKIVLKIITSFSIFKVYYVISFLIIIFSSYEFLK